MMGRIIHFILFFLYVSNIQFTFFPDKLRTRLIVSIIGFFYYIFRFKGSDYCRSLNLLKLIFPLAVWMSFSIVINMSDQIWFLQYVVLQMVYAMGAIFVIHVCKIYEFRNLLWMFLIYVVIQCTIAFVLFQIPTLIPLLYSIQVPELSIDRANDLLNIRAIGIGEFGLFGGGAWVAVGMLALTVLYKMKSVNGVVFVVIFCYLLITGLFVARTTLTGLLSLVLLLIPLKKNWYKPIIWIILGGGIFTPSTSSGEKS